MNRFLPVFFSGVEDAEEEEEEEDEDEEEEEEDEDEDEEVSSVWFAFALEASTESDAAGETFRATGVPSWM